MQLLGDSSVPRRISAAFMDELSEAKRRSQVSVIQLCVIMHVLRIMFSCCAKRIWKLLDTWNNLGAFAFVYVCMHLLIQRAICFKDLFVSLVTASFRRWWFQSSLVVTTSTPFSLPNPQILRLFQRFGVCCEHTETPDVLLLNVYGFPEFVMQKLA